VHDRSDGGLFAAACEMAFAGHVGVALNVDLLVTEGDGISDSRAETATPRTGRQVSARREELTLKALFNEELGVLLQVRTAERNDVMQVLRAHGLSAHSHFVGKTRPASSTLDVGKGKVEVWRDAKSVFSASLHDLHQVWDRSAGRSPASATTRPAPMPSTPRPASLRTRACMCSCRTRSPRAPAILSRAPRSRSCASRASTRTSRWLMRSPKRASRPTTCT
jgi:phosphoribosylformylglycinamidine synthase